MERRERRDYIFRKREGVKISILKNEYIQGFKFLKSQGVCWTEGRGNAIELKIKPGVGQGRERPRRLGRAGPLRLGLSK